MIHFLNIHSIFVPLSYFKVTSNLMKKYTKYFIVIVTLAISVPVLKGQEKSNADERLVRIETTLGNMVVKLFNETPAHRDNMIKLVEEGYYDSLLFHRVISDFMVQGGDPHSKDAAKGQRLGQGGPGYTIPAEFNENLYHKKGALAAARQGDQANPEKRSSGSQFYITQGRVFTPAEMNTMAQRGMGPFSNEAIAVYTSLGGTPHLDGAYTVFGEVVEGLDVLDRIAAVATDAYNRPREDVVFSISLVR
jgi:peptidyl-prolyl cis-trans isomerase B (cyclophilin B)